MYVFELTIPGTWLDYEDRQWTWKIEGLLSHLESLFFEENFWVNLLAMSGDRAVSIELLKWIGDLK
jgi:hypothetical protein